jgi:fumarate reductase subunit D
MLLRQSHETFFFSLFSMGGVWDICLFFSSPGFVLFIAVAVLLTHAHDGKYIGKNI